MIDKISNNDYTNGSMNNEIRKDIVEEKYEDKIHKDSIWRSSIRVFEFE